MPINLASDTITRGAETRKAAVNLFGMESLVKTRFSVSTCVIGLICALSVLNLVQFYKPRHMHDLNNRFAQHRQSSHATGDLPGKAVVLASYRAQDVSWALKLPSTWRIYRYILDDPSVFPNTMPTNNLQLTHFERLYNETYTVPRNQGSEAMAYLSYIIDNYDRLPLFTVFLHGHSRAWHQVEPAEDKLRALNLSAVASDGYASFRCRERPCRPNNFQDVAGGPDKFSWAPMKVLPELWSLLLPDVPRPKKMQTPLNGQFAVSRRAIQARSLDFWKAMRRPLERDPKEYRKLLPHLEEGGAVASQGDEGWVLGLIYEHIWHVLFGKLPVYCPGEDYCRGTVFSGALSCDAYLDDDDFGRAVTNITCMADENVMAQNAKSQDEVVAALRRAI